MATFADMVTLLLCFFVLLLSFAKQDVNKFRDLMGSIKNAFGVQIKRPEAEFSAFSPSQYERKDVELNQENKEMLDMVLQLKQMVVQDEQLKKIAKIATDDKGVILRIPNKLLFDSGSATVKKDADKVLQYVVKTLNELNFDVVVRGHTADVYEKSATYPSNWELTSSRAAAALRRILETSEIPASRLKAVGYADSQPLVPNTTDANRSINNRTEFYFHKPSDKVW